MNRYYVELACSDLVIPWTTKASCPEEAMESSERLFAHCADFQARLTVCLSTDADACFEHVAGWGADTWHLVHPDTFCRTVTTMWKEGEAIADLHANETQEDLKYPLPVYTGISPEELHTHIHCPSTLIQEGERLLFSMIEAVVFMSAMIREGVARRVQETNFSGNY